MQITGRDYVFLLDGIGRNWTLHTDFVSSFKVRLEEFAPNLLKLAQTNLKPDIWLFFRRTIRGSARGPMGSTWHVPDFGQRERTKS